MDWVIYTLGDGGFLAQVFNSIAAITHSNEDDYNTAIKVAMMVGILFMFGKGILTGGRVNLGYAFLALVLFYALVFPKVEVDIEDLYDGSVRTVANVPLGVAITGHISSHVGYVIAGWFDQGFTPPDATAGFTEGGYLKGLQILTNLRTALLNPSNYSAANAAGGGDYVQSWINYIQDCTLVEVELGGGRTIDGILSGDNLMAQLKFDSPVYATKYNTSGAWVVANCDVAHDELVNHYTVSFYDALMNDLRRKLLRPEDVAVAAGADVITEIDHGLSLIGQAGLDVSSYTATNLLAPLVVESISGKYETDQKYSAHIMVQQAIAQRNVQWSSEQSVFMHYFRPIYSFLEAMVYAVTPVMGILIMLGPTGASLVGKQLMALVWIQLWLPMLAIANMYIYGAIVDSVDTIALLGVALTSASGLDMLTSELATKIAVGGYMAASAPALAGFLVFGSSVALTHLAQRVQGADTTDEKYVAPAVQENRPIMGTESLIRHNALSGVTSSAAQGIGGEIHIGESMSRTVGSSQSRAESATSAWRESVDAGTESVMRHAQSRGHSHDLARSVGSEFARGQHSNYDNVRGWASGISSDQRVREALMSTLAGRVTGGASFGSKEALKMLNDQLGTNWGQRDLDQAGGDFTKLLRSAGFSVGVDAAATTQSSNDASKSSGSSLNMDDLDRVAQSKGVRADYKEALAGKLTDSKQERWEDAITAKVGQQLSQSDEERQQAQEAYEAVSRHAEEMGSRHSVGLFEGAGILNRSGAGAHYKQVAQTRYGDTYRGFARQFAGLADDGETEVGAAIRTLERHDPQMYQEAVNAIWNGNMSMGDPQRNANLAENSRTSGLRNRVDGATQRASDVVDPTAAVAQQMDTPLSANRDPDPRNLVGDEASFNDARVRGAADGNDSAFSFRHVDEAGLRMRENHIEPNFGQNASALGRSAMQSLDVLLEAGGRGYSAAFAGTAEFGQQIANANGQLDPRQLADQGAQFRIEGMFGSTPMSALGGQVWWDGFAQGDAGSVADRVARGDQAFQAYMADNAAGMSEQQFRDMNVGAAMAATVAQNTSSNFDAGQIARTVQDNFEANQPVILQNQFDWAQQRAEAAGVSDPYLQGVYAQGYVEGTWGGAKMSAADALEDYSARFGVSYEPGFSSNDARADMTDYLQNLWDQNHVNQPYTVNGEDGAAMYDIMYRAGADGSTEHGLSSTQSALRYYELVKGQDDVSNDTDRRAGPGFNGSEEPEPIVISRDRNDWESER